MKKALTALALLASISTAQAQDNSTAAANANRVTLNMAKSALAAQADKADNLVLSPYNAMTNMALVGSGAATATLDEFAKTLFETGGDAMAAAVAQFTQLNTDILAANKGHVDLLTANGIWVNKDAATLSDVYEQKARDNFGASISSEDFGDTATVDKINTWASENTKGLISKVIKELQKDNAMVLASALYFKGQWTHKFDKADTKDKTFTADGGKAYTTKMMSQNFDEGDITWQERDGYEAAALTYGTVTENNKYPTMRIVLVRPKDAKLAARDWLAQQDKAEWLEAGTFERVRGLVELPHLDIKQHHDLVPVLQAMGIKGAFESSADFRPMVDAKMQPLFISAVSHDVVFKTDEEGSEAAAVTTATMAGSALAPQEPKTVSIKLDRSFVFALQDARTGTVLFLGAVNKPNEEMK